MNDNKKINNSIGGNNYGLNFTPTSSYLTGDTIQTSVPYAANQANNFSNQVDEMDLNINNDVEQVEIPTSEWLLSTTDFLEQLRTANKEELQRVQTETDELTKKYQEFLTSIPLSLECQEKINELREQQNDLRRTHYYSATSPYAHGIEAQLSNLENQISALIKEDQLKYIKEHPDEFNATIGMGYDEYNQKIESNTYIIAELSAKDYELRQQAKELPYLDIMMTEDYINYTSTHSEASAPSMNYLENRNLENYLTEDQLIMFSYLYDTKGWQEAYKYLEAIEDKINQAKGMAEAQVFLSSITDEDGNVDVSGFEYTLKTMGKGLWNGIENFGEGFENLFDVNSDGMITDNQYAQQFILQGLSELQNNGHLPQYIDDTYQISTSIGNMLPGMVISILTCGTAGQVLMGMSAAGNAKNQALVSMSDNKALAYTYGLLNGASEAVIGKIMGNIPGLNESAKFAFKEILSEGAEEFVQTFTDAGFKLVVYGEVPNLEELTEEGLRSFVYGCITSGLMTGGQTAISFTISGVKYSYNSISELMNAYSEGKITCNSNNDNVENIDANISSNSIFVNDATDDGAISRANYHTSKGITQTFRFSDASNIPDINSNFWAGFDNPELIQINVDGKIMTLEDAISYKMNYDLNIRGEQISMEEMQMANSTSNVANATTKNVFNKITAEIRSNRKNGIVSSIVEADIMSIIEKHNQKYNYGLLQYSAEESLLKFIDPQDINYGRYNVISSNEGGRSILSKYTPAQIAAGLSNLGYNIGNVPVDNSILQGHNFTELSGWYDYNSNAKYGVDQGAIENLCVYTLNGKKYNYRAAKDIVNEAIKKGQVIPNFKKEGTQEYFKLKTKLENMGFSKNDASVILSSINDAGACSYASLANEIFFSFRNNIDLFEKSFGYSYYKDGNINNGVNDTELLLDLYLFANDVKNGGTFIWGNKLINRGNTIDVFGRRILDAENQVYMSFCWGRNNSIIDSFIKSKSLDFNYSSLVIDNTDGIHYYNDYEFEELKRQLTNYMTAGYTLSMNYFYNKQTNDRIIRMNNIDGRMGSLTTANWGEGGGHSVAITGMNNEGFIISSWGAKFVIPFEDLKNGGRFNICFSKIDLM